MRETDIGKRREILIQFRSVDAISTLQTMMWAVCVCVWSKWVRDRKEHAAGREEALSLYLFFREAKVNSFHVDDKPYAVPLQQPIKSTWIGHILVVRRYVNRIGRFQCVEHTYPQITYAHTHTLKPKWKRMHQTVKYYKHSIKALTFSHMEYHVNETFFSFIKLLLEYYYYIMIIILLYFYTINSCVGCSVI